MVTASVENGSCGMWATLLRKGGRTSRSAKLLVPGLTEPDGAAERLKKTPVVADALEKRATSPELPLTCLYEKVKRYVMP
jgi:hypothetical protein